MDNRTEFTQVLREVLEIVKASDKTLSKEEIISYFNDFELTKEQNETIFTYLISDHEEPDNQEADTKNTENAADDNDDLLPSSVTFQMYMEEIASLKKYSDEQVSQMCESLIQGDSSVIKSLSEHMLPSVYEMAKLHLSEKYSIEDVIQEGNMGMFVELGNICDNRIECEVIERTKEAINNAMKAYISEVTGLSDSENAVVGKVNLINDARQYLTGQNGSIPSMKELSDYTHIDEDELADILKLIDEK